jgi:biotin synthase-related radical SAM superfamily protein
MTEYIIRPTNEVAVMQNCVSHPVDNASMEKRIDCTISKYQNFVTARYYINMNKVAIHYHLSVS